MVAGSGISETFVGLILLPIVGNAAEVRLYLTSPNVSTSQL
jgi:Ca2+/H+ antiporter